MKYEGVICPVCGVVFDKDSDVVVCPECGTPHHRACYETNGTCINESHHSDEFVWINPNKPAEPVEKPKKRAETVDPATLNKENMPKNGVIGEMETGPMGMPSPTYRVISGNEKIGNYIVDDYAQVVGKNLPKFMPRFLMMGNTGKKINWNWPAFFFGPLYLAYRKMYKYAIISLILILIIPIICFNEVSQYYNDFFEDYCNLILGSASMTSEEMNEALETYEANLPAEPQALIVSSYIEMAIDLLCGLFANYLYFKHCTKIIDKSQKYTDPVAKSRYLRRKGGRSIASLILFVLLKSSLVIVIITINPQFSTDLATILRGYIK